MRRTLFLLIDIINFVLYEGSGEVMLFINCILLLLFSILVVTTPNAVNSVLYLICTFVCGAWIMFIFGAEFIALMTIFVYIGAVAILFLTVIMFVNLKTMGNLNEHGYFIGFIVFTVIAGGALQLVGLSFFRPVIVVSGNKLYIYSSVIDKTMVFSVIDSNFIQLCQTTVIQLGTLLYSKYLAIVLCCSFMLFVAIFGCATITKGFVFKTTKTQVIRDQILVCSRKPNISGRRFYCTYTTGVGEIEFDVEEARKGGDNFTQGRFSDKNPEMVALLKRVCVKIKKLPRWGPSTRVREKRNNDFSNSMWEDDNFLKISLDLYKRVRFTPYRKVLFGNIRFAYRYGKAILKDMFSCSYNFLKNKRKERLEKDEIRDVLYRFEVFKKIFFSYEREKSIIRLRLFDIFGNQLEQERPVWRVLWGGRGYPVAPKNRVCHHGWYHIWYTPTKKECSIYNFPPNCGLEESEFLDRGIPAEMLQRRIDDSIADQKKYKIVHIR